MTFEELALWFGNLPGELLTKARQDLLPEAGRIMEKYQIGTIQSKGLVDTGQMRDSIGVKVFSDRVNVYPMGTRARGEKRFSNAAVGFMQHYTEGRGEGWMVAANERAEEDVFELAQKAFEEILEG